MRLRTFTAVVGLWVVVVVGGDTAWGVTSWDKPFATGGWFTDSNWRHGVPGAFDSTTVGQGGTAVASFEPGLGDLLASDLKIGFGFSNLFPHPFPGGNGTVQVSGLDIVLNSRLLVGQVFGDGSVVGTLNTDSNVTIGGSAAFSGDAFIGFHDSGSVPIVQHTAIGTATIGGDFVSGGNSPTLYIGRSDTTEAADGTLSLSGRLLGFVDVRVGQAHSSGPAVGEAMFFNNNIGPLDEMAVGIVNAAGNATGLVKVDDGNLTGIGSTSNLEVGVSEGAGVANGEVDVTGALAGFDDVFVGVSRFSTGTGAATGALKVGGVFVGSGVLSSQFVIGGTFAGGLGEGHGAVTLGSGMSGFDSVDVGVGPGTGQLTIDAGGLVSGNGFNFFDIGINSGTGTAVITGGVTGFRLVDVGVVTLTGAGPSELTMGTLTINTLGLTGTGTGSSKLTVGETSFNSPATGILKTFGGGGVSGFEDVEVGVTTSEGDATGQMVLAGSLVGTGVLDSALEIGLSAGAGMADGAVFVGGDLGGFEDVSIGVSEDAGDAIGELIVSGDATDMDRIVHVGVSTGATSTGQATGTLNVGGR